MRNFGLSMLFCSTMSKSGKVTDSSLKYASVHRQSTLSQKQFLLNETNCALHTGNSVLANIHCLSVKIFTQLEEKDHRICHQNFLQKEQKEQIEKLQSLKAEYCICHYIIAHACITASEQELHSG